MATLFGGDGPDSITGTTSDDLIYAGAGDDSVFGDTGNDTIFGVSGTNTLSGGDGDDFIQGDGEAVVNPGFDAGVPPGGLVVFATNTGWQSTSGSIEVWGSGFEGITSPDGSNFMELDQEPNSVDAIWQDIQTVAGRTYTLTIQARNRPGAGENDSFEIRWGGVLIDTVQPGPAWVDYTYTVTGDGGVMRLELSELAEEDNFRGIFLNTVSLVSNGDGDDSGAFGTSQLYGGAGNDTLIAAASENNGSLLYGGSGADNIVGSNAADTIYGGTGVDTIYAQGGDDLIFSVDGSDLIYAGAGNDTIDGGTSGADTIFGDAGNDTISGGVDFDLLYGGDGNDLIYGDRAGGGSSASDTIYGDAGDDTIFAVTSSAVGAASLLYGGIGNDQITGSGAADTIYGGADDDILFGGAGADIISGDEGNDTLYGGTGADTLYSGAGNDLISSGPGDNLIFGGTGSDTILLASGFGNDTIYGGDGVGDRDVLDATAITEPVAVFFNADGTADVLEGISPSQAQFSGIEAVLLGDGTDFLNASLSTNAIEVSGGGGDDSIVGSAFNDTLYGGAGDDTIEAGAGNDLLFGGDGNDQLVSGDGNDTLTGGAGADTFVISGSGADVITDFDATTNVKDGNSANNDFVNLTAFYNATTLAAWNAANPTNTFTTPIGLLRYDIVQDGILNESAAGWTAGNSLTLTGVAASDLNDENTGVICFAAGTQIKTIAGDVAVEDLQVGFRVLTMDAGYQTIRWIGSRHLSAVELAAQPNLRPIRIAAGALGRNAPETDLIVSPQHRILVRSTIAERMFGMREVLVPAKLLLDYPGVSIMDDAQGVTYWHFLFEAHQVVFANGMPAESLFTGPEALKSVGEEARAEILAIFPQLADLDVDALPRAARLLAKGKKARKMVWRMVKNDHDALAPQPPV